MALLKSLYPEIECLNQSELRIDDHTIYFEESGNVEGIPVIFLHGGPGSGCNPNHRRYFDPDRYRIVIFDQRGCNRSSPQGSVTQNTTQKLLADIERIRQQLHIDKWLVFGGSWGATLGLLYAETCPQQIAGLILRGTFLARQCDLDWYTTQGASKIFPDFWQDFIKDIPEKERNDLVSAYYERIINGDQKTREKFSLSWSLWATRVVTSNLLLYKNEKEDINTTVNQSCIETHYAKNRYFIKENQILNDISRIPEVPAIIIHGRKDLTCVLEASWLVHQALPGSELVIVEEGGHLAGEAVMINALINATDKMKTLL